MLIVWLWLIILIHIYIYTYTNYSIPQESCFACFDDILLQDLIILIIVAHFPQLIGRSLLAATRNTYMVVGSLLVTCIIGFIFVGYQAGPSLYPINFNLSRRRKQKSVEKTPHILRCFSPLFRLRKMRCFDTTARQVFIPICR